jgi:hypothetical protein
METVVLIWLVINASILLAMLTTERGGRDG